jgi:hypothetical protein
MAQPPAYARQSNWTNFSTDYPGEQPTGSLLDAEFNAIKTTLTAVLSNLAEIQRDDLELANLSVGIDQLKAEIEIGFASIGDWVTATDYALRDGVWQTNVLYRCIVAHTSGTFATDLAAGKWTVVLDLATPLAAAVTAAAAAAATSATNAATSATNAATSASAASTSAAAAAASATAASGSATTASTQATNAAASAAAAAASAASIPSGIFTRTTTTPYTGVAGDQIIMDCSLADKTYTMPASPSTSHVGILIKKLGTYTLTIDFGSNKAQLPDGTFASGTHTITGAWSGTLRLNYVGTIADSTTLVWSVSY